MYCEAQRSCKLNRERTVCHVCVQFKHSWLIFRKKFWHCKLQTTVAKIQIWNFENFWRQEDSGPEYVQCCGPTHATLHTRYTLHSTLYTLYTLHFVLCFVLCVPICVRHLKNERVRGKRKVKSGDLLNDSLPSAFVHSILKPTGPTHPLNCACVRTNLRAKLLPFLTGLLRPSIHQRRTMVSWARPVCNLFQVNPLEDIPSINLLLQNLQSGAYILQPD